jgi:predicted AlkP superfamily pyrophosphatase or phosphodiesterase
MIFRLAVPALCVVFSLAVLTAQDRPSAAVQPRLIVMLVVDQLRTDYLENYGRHFTSGLKRLRDEGAWFRRGAYPYLGTVTCAGHSTIGTGTFPYRHGMVLNRWWDRADGRARSCTDDPSVQNIAHGGTSNGHDSAATLMAPTLAEVLRRDHRGRSVSVSLKARSAIGLSGRGKAPVLWQERMMPVTSSAFADAPIDWVTSFASANPVSADAGKTWERMLPLASYVGEDDVKGERFPTGWAATFPHRIGEPAAQLEAQWQRTPLADEYLGRLALHAVDTLKLGRGEGIDFLGVSFSTLDLVGHQFGPDSHEVQDIVFRLDATIGRLISALDARLGKGGYVLGLSSDHGVSTLTERTGGGRHLAAEIAATIDKALVPHFGAGKHVIHGEYTDVYLAPGIFEKVKATPAAWTAIREALLALPGLAHVYRSDEVASAAARTSEDPARRAAALSHFPARSGDIIIVPKENWLFSSAAATHGTLHTYDQRVPVLLFGAGVTPVLSDTPATPADLAPSLAALAGVRFDTPDGKALVRTAAGVK